MIIKDPRGCAVWLRSASLFLRTEVCEYDFRMSQSFTHNIRAPENHASSSARAEEGTNSPSHLIPSSQLSSPIHRMLTRSTVPRQASLRPTERQPQSPRCPPRLRCRHSPLRNRRRPRSTQSHRRNANRRRRGVKAKQCSYIELISGFAGCSADENGVQVFLNIVLDEAVEEKAGGEGVRLGMVVRGFCFYLSTLGLCGGLR